MERREAVEALNVALKVSTSSRVLSPVTTAIDTGQLEPLTKTGTIRLYDELVSRGLRWEGPINEAKLLRESESELGRSAARRRIELLCRVGYVVDLQGRAGKHHLLQITDLGIEQFRNAPAPLILAAINEYMTGLGQVGLPDEPPLDNSDLLNILDYKKDIRDSWKGVISPDHREDINARFRNQNTIHRRLTVIHSEDAVAVYYHLLLRNLGNMPEISGLDLAEDTSIPATSLDRLLEPIKEEGLVDDGREKRFSGHHKLSAGRALIEAFDKQVGPEIHRRTCDFVSQLRSST